MSLNQTQVSQFFNEARGGKPDVVRMIANYIVRKAGDEISREIAARTEGDAAPCQKAVLGRVEQLLEQVTSDILHHVMEDVQNVAFTVKYVPAKFDVIFTD